MAPSADENIASRDNQPYQDFIFQRRLNLRKILKYWQDVDSSLLGLGGQKQKVMEYVLRYPELGQEEVDFSVLLRHKDFIQSIMGIFVSHHAYHNQLFACLAPFSNEKVFCTELFAKLKVEQYDGQKVKRTKETIAYLMVLKCIYGLELQSNFTSYVLQGRMPGDMLPRFYQIQLDTSFCEVINLNGPKSLSSEQVALIKKNCEDLETWKKILNPNHYSINGVVFIRFLDITDQAVVSNIKKDLITRDVFTDPQKFLDLEDKFKILLGNTNFSIAVSSFFRTTGGKCKLARSFAKKTTGKEFKKMESLKISPSEFEQSVFKKAKEKQDILIIDDLNAMEHPRDVNKKITDLGTKNMVICPLYHDGCLVGFLDISSENSGEFSYLMVNKLHEIQALLAMAIIRNKEEVEAKFESIIKKQCTAIHPSVEWRFQEAARNAYSKGLEARSSGMEPIIFHGVFPLFGVSDIRSSSTLRNKAIQEDLKAQLLLAKKTIESAVKTKPLSLLDETIFRLDESIREIANGLNVGEELSIFNLIRSEVESIFPTIEDFNDETREAVSVYKQQLDPELGMIYKSRKNYEESVSKLNAAVCAFIDSEQLKAQEMFPHYFEKQSTDGVDHSIYIGESMAVGHEFSSIYLQNLRIWQLMLTCGIAHVCERIRPQLKVPLDLAHLIAVQNSPISIKFDYEEKQFGVEGAYNVRYEIMKKRIDKATIKNTDERLTQPRMISVVYTQRKEQEEYLRYVAYLKAKGFFKGECEDLELNDLQGIHGLKALRIEIDIESLEKVFPQIS